MGRAIAGVICGFLAACAAVMILMSGAEFALGRDRVFQPQSQGITMTWGAVWFTTAVGAALLGGWVCAAIARRRSAVFALMGVMLAMGLLSAVLEQNMGEASGQAEAQARAKPPLGISLANPILGALGVAAGGLPRLRRDKNQS